MRAAEPSAIGDVGLGEVGALFGRIHWAPLQNKDCHDLGTDLLVAARDPRRFDRGLLVGVQVKSGESWFKEPANNETGELIGWWHRNDSDHYDYWVRHHLPHLLVLYDMDQRIAYWVHVTAQRCESTGKGVKILVPRANTITESNAQKLLSVAVEQKGSISLEGTAFDAAATHVAPGDRLRFALLIPRLIAPHANRENKDNPEPEEAIALLVLLHVQRLQGLLEKGTIWPNLNVPPSTRDWRWRFAYAIWRFIGFNETDSIRERYEEACAFGAERADWRAAAAVVLISVLLLEGGTSEATFVVTSELASDSAAPIDHAWLLLHASRCATESGRRDVAREYASKALLDLSIDTDDPTASLLSGIGYRITFNLGAWEDGVKSIAATLKAGDNAGSWWRDQQLRWALDAAAIEQFREWAADNSSRWEAEPPSQQLLPSMLMALFTADHAGWVAAESRIGRHDIQRATTPSNFGSAFLRLIRSGDKSSAMLAGQRAWNFGPAAELAKASVYCVPEILGPTRIEIMLGFWKKFGDLGHPGAAKEIIEWCLKAMIMPEMTGGRRPQTADLLRTICSTLPVTSESEYQLVADNLRNVPISDTRLGELCGVIEVLQGRSPKLLDVGLILTIARKASENHESAKLFGIAAEIGSVEAGDELLNAVRRNNLIAAVIAFDHELLPDEMAAVVAHTLVEQLERERRDARNGRVGLGYSVDRCSFLVSLNLRFPSIDLWSCVAEYLGDANVIADHKGSACRKIVRNASIISEDVRSLIALQTGGLRRSRYMPQNMLDIRSPASSAGGLADYVDFKMRPQSPQAVEDYIGRAFANGGHSKALAWQILLELAPAGYDLSAIQGLEDSDLVVRVRAAEFIGLRIANNADSPALRISAAKLVEDGSVILPRAFLTGLTPDCPDWVKSLVAPLHSHYAVSVRDRARLVTG